jgi:hypothetical protein
MAEYNTYPLWRRMAKKEEFNAKVQSGEGGISGSQRF